METMEILKLAVVILIGYFILKFIWGAAKGIIKLVLGVIVIAVGVYVMNPEMLYNVFGKDNVESVRQEAENGIDKGKKIISEKVDSATEDAVNSAKEKVKNVTN